MSCFVGSFGFVLINQPAGILGCLSIVCLAETREGFVACTNDREPRKDFNSDSYVHCLRLETDIPMQGTQAQREGYCILVLLR